MMFFKGLAPISMFLAASTPLYGGFIAGTASTSDVVANTGLSPYFAAGGFAKNDDLDDLNQRYSATYGTFTYGARTGDDPGISFTGLLSGTVTFGATEYPGGISDPFVLALKADGHFSYYFFDPTGQSAVTSVDFSTTTGVAVKDNGSGDGADLSHATLYFGGGAPSGIPGVPEPSSLVLWAIGTAALAGARIRKSA